MKVTSLTNPKIIAAAVSLIQQIVFGGAQKEQSPKYSITWKK